MDYFFLGEAELVTAFRFIGITGQPVHSADDARDAFRRLTQSYDETAGTVLPDIETCRVLIITEEVAEWLGDTLVKWQLSDRYPLIVELPGLMGRMSNRKTLTESIREAIGVSV